MDLYCHIHKCLNTACQKWRTNVTNLKYSIKLLLLQQQQLKHIEKTRCMKYCNWWLKYLEIADFSLSWRNSPVLKLFLLHQQHHRVQKTSLNGFSGCRTTQNQREREREIMSGRGRVGSEEGRGVRMCDGWMDCAFLCLFGYPHRTHVKPMKAYFCHGI